jgi:serine/threonine protein kinase
LENKFYQKKNNEENKFKYTNKNSCLDDSLIESKINQKDIPNLNMYFFIQMEYCQGLNLSEYINNNIKTGINNKIIYLFTYQIIKSLAKIHENKIVHRGINPENIFVINESQIKIGGFSSAKEIKSSIHINKVNKKKKIMYSQSTGNLGIFANNLQENNLDKENFGHSLYLSPEQEQGYQVTKKSDIYSAGLVIYTMCECIEKSKRQKIITKRLTNPEIAPIMEQIHPARFLFPGNRKDEYLCENIHYLDIQRSLRQRWKPYGSPPMKRASKKRRNCCGPARWWPFPRKRCTAWGPTP